MRGRKPTTCKHGCTPKYKCVECKKEANKLYRSRYPQYTQERKVVYLKEYRQPIEKKYIKEFGYDKKSIIFKAIFQNYKIIQK